MKDNNLLLSVLVELRVISPTIILGPLGIPIHGWLLSQIQQYDPDYSKHLHDLNDKKPYTISTLLDDNGSPLGVGRKLDSGDRCWIRITGFDDTFNLLLISKILAGFRKKPTSIKLYKMDFLIYDHTFNRANHPLARKSTYTEFVQSIKNFNPIMEVNLHFHSPTAIQSDGIELPLPLPVPMFGKYLEGWNKYCPANLKIDEGWSTFTKSFLLLNIFSSIETYEWVVPGKDQHGESLNIKTVGFKGVAKVKLLKKQKYPYSSDVWNDTLVVMQLLADFSFYCGTGHHTSVGMGQTTLFPLEIGYENR